MPPLLMLSSAGRRPHLLIVSSLCSFESRFMVWMVIVPGICQQLTRLSSAC